MRRHALASAAALALMAPGAQALNYTWSGGDFVPGTTAPSPLGAGDVLNINTGGFKTFNASNFTNGGTVNWNADNLYLVSAAAVVNNGLWNAGGDNNLFYNGGAAPSFTNNSIFRKSGGTGATTINSGVGFANNGTLDAQTGTLSFVGGTVFNAGSVFIGAGTNLAAGNNMFSGSFTSANLVLGSGVHSGNAAVMGGSVAYTGGSLSGTWSVGAGQTLNAGTGGFKIVDGAGTVVSNLGTVAWNTTDLLYLQSGATFSNQALFVANASTSIVYNGGAATTFNNTAGGTVRAAAGQTLTIGGSAGFVNNGGTLDAQAGAAIAYNGASFNAGTQFTGAGSNRAAGNNGFSGSFTSANLVLESGVHSGNAAVMGGSVNYAGGTLSGTWSVGAGQTLNATTGGFKQVDGGATVLSNLGTVAWNTSDALYLLSGATVSNQGLFVANTSTTVLYNGGAAPIFDNTASGTVRAAAGQTLTIGGGAGFVNNGGVLDAQAGAAIVYNGATFNAGTQFSGAGSNRAAGSNTFNGGFSSANLVLEGGVHSGNGAVVGGSAVYKGGDLVGTWQVAPGQTLSAADGAFKQINGGATVVTNRGTVNWGTGDYLYLLSGATLANAGTLNFSANGGVLYNGGAQPSFVNTGLITKTGAAGTTTISDTLAFDNLGTIDVQTGTLALPGNFTNRGTLTGVGSYAVAGTLNNAGTVAPGASPGTLALSGNYAQAAGGTFAVELASLASHDLFNVTGAAALNGTLAISCWAACSLAVGDVVTILDAVGDISGSFSSVVLSGFQTGAFDVIYDTAGDRVQLLVTQAVTAAVPEPGTWAMWLAGAAMLGGLMRRRRA
jgi:hypothetical protein